MRIVSVEELTRRLAQLPGRPRVVASGNAAIPWVGLRAVDDALAEYTLHVLNAPPGVPDRPGVTAETCFVGSGMRHTRAWPTSPAGCRWCRCSCSDDPRRRRAPALRAAARRHVARHRGQRAAGGDRGFRARGGLVIAQVNDACPTLRRRAVHRRRRRPRGRGRRVRCRGAAPAAVDELPLASASWWPARVADGATLQLGIGAVPDATLAALTERRELRVWTEMFSDGVLALERAGAIDRDVPLTASFLFGSQELYDWVDGNPRVRMLRTETDNDPARSPGSAMTSVNTALAGRPLRPGQRLADQPAHPLRVRRPDRLHRRRAARARRAGLSSRCARGTPRRTCRRSCR